MAVPVPDGPQGHYSSVCLVAVWVMTLGTPSLRLARAPGRHSQPRDRARALAFWPPPDGIPAGRSADPKGSCDPRATGRKSVDVRTVFNSGPRKPVTKTNLKLITPTTDLRTVVTPRRKPNAELRTREYLTETEVEALTDAAKDNRWGHRDATMILVAYRHGLRVSELVDLRWDQIDFDRATLARPSRQTRQVRPPTRFRATSCARCAGCNASGTLSRRSCSRPSAARPSPRPALPAWWNVPGYRPSSASRRIPTCSGTPAVIALANKGHDTRSLQAYLGHKNIQHTVRYTELSPDRFKDFWR